MPIIDPRELALSRTRRTGDAGRSAEAKTAQRLGGRLVPGSGCGTSNKADINVGRFRIENKSTQRKSLGVKLAWLMKIAAESQTCGRTPALALQFTDPDGNPLTGGAWVMIPEHTFKELTE